MDGLLEKKGSSFQLGDIVSVSTKSGWIFFEGSPAHAQGVVFSQLPSEAIRVTRIILESEHVLAVLNYKTH